MWLTIQEFDTETGWDGMTINGIWYSGYLTSAIPTTGLYLAAGQSMIWQSDGSVTRPGFTICGSTTSGRRQLEERVLGALALALPRGALRNLTSAAEMTPSWAPEAREAPANTSSRALSEAAQLFQCAIENTGLGDCGWLGQKSECWKGPQEYLGGSWLPLGLQGEDVCCAANAEDCCEADVVAIVVLLAVLIAVLIVSIVVITVAAICCQCCQCCPCNKYNADYRRRAAPTAHGAHTEMAVMGRPAQGVAVATATPIASIPTAHGVVVGQAMQGQALGSPFPTSGTQGTVVQAVRC